ncbi:MAG: AAA family ATPase, partial [Gaiellaceae bacterium]
AYELRDGVHALGLQARIGVNTGDVITAAGDTLVTGDAVNVAARLEQAAPPGDILLGEATHRLCRDGVRAERVEGLALKGKAEPVAAFRLLDVLEDMPAALVRPFDAPLVGRAAELGAIRACLDAAVAERGCRVVTAVGSPGIGKSRLAREFFASLEGVAAVLSGRCLPYGEGITYWPLLEIFREAGAEDELTAALAAGTPEEVSFSVRKSLEQRARQQPLVLVVEDIHWAEPTLLDLIEHLADWTRDAPLLLLCLARPEFADKRPGLVGGRANAIALTLEPLSEDEADALIEALLHGSPLEASARASVREAAGGNPLFVEQLIAMQAEGGDPDHVPPTIRALLSARLDALPEPERDLLESASVVGLDFGLESLAALTSNGGNAARELLPALVRKELIRPDEARPNAYRFRHMLIRDAAYERLLKARRAELHERFADYLESFERVPQRDELIGYHLEHAYQAQAALDAVAPARPELGRRAAGYLGRAGLGAFARSDIPATIGLLQRASRLLAPGDAQRLRLLPELGSALAEAGRFDDARQVLDDAIEEARRVADRAAEGKARIEQLWIRLGVEPGEVTPEAEAAVRELVPLFEALSDDEALARVWRLSGFVSLMRSRFGELGVAMQRALEHALRAGNEREQGLVLFWIPQGAVWGPMPAEEGIAMCERLLADAAGSTSAEAGVLNGLSMLYAMVGRADDARRALQQSGEMYRELGLEVLYAVATMHAGPVELYLGDLPRAELGLVRAIEVFERLGERGYRSTAEAWRAQTLNRQERYAEAEEATRLSEELAAADDTPSQLGWRTERARALAHRGELEEAERLAREAVALAQPTDSLVDIGECAFALAETINLAGRTDEAAAAAAGALEAWERKGIVGYVARARVLLDELRVAA